MKLINPEIVVISTNPEFQVPKTHIVYSDLSPDESKILLSVNADAILVSLCNLLSTEKGERLNLPEYGVNLPDYVFELMDESAKTELLVRIFTEVTAWEPRVLLDIANSYVEEFPDDYVYKVHLTFIIKGLANIVLKYSGILTRTKSLFRSD